MRVIDIIKEADVQPAGEYRLVRVVPAIDNIIREPDGTLSIRQQTGSTRNSIHWTMNSTVGSHTLGNWDNAGYVVIADPKQIKAPLLGARPDDTWYALDKNRKLNIGKATILAPQGASVPPGIPVQYYSGDRSQAVKQVLNKQGVQYMGATGATGVGGLDINQFGKMGRDFAAKHSNQGPGTLDSHMNTLHSQAEGKLAGINYAIDKMQSGQKYIQLDTKAEVPYTTHTQQEIKDFKQSIADYQKQNPKTAAYELDYWSRINQQLDQASKQIDIVDAKLQADKASRKKAATTSLVPPPPPPRPTGMYTPSAPLERPSTGIGSINRSPTGPTMGGGNGPPSAGSLLRQINPLKI